MALEKLKIKNLDNKTQFEVLFNPTEYTVDDSNKWKPQSKPRYKTELQYTGGDRKKLSMELFFDTYDQKSDVRQHTGEFAKLLIPTVNDRGQGKRPPKVQLQWGGASVEPAKRIFPFTCVLEKLTQKFTMFDETGTPVRATLTVSFIEFNLPEEELQENPRRNSYPVQTYTVRSRETLSGIAANLWNDPSKWRKIAEHEGNRINNPRLIEPGQTLIIPRIN